MNVAMTTQPQTSLLSLLMALAVALSASISHAQYDMGADAAPVEAELSATDTAVAADDTLADEVIESEEDWL